MTDNIKDRRVTLIGGSGFIGFNLAIELARLGAEVHVIDSLQVNNLLYFAAGGDDLHNRKFYLKIINYRLEALNEAGIKLHPLDARDYHALSHLLTDIEPHALIHLAAVAHAGRSNKDPFSTFDHSLRTLENALDCARTRIEHFVFFSSSMAYGNFLTEEVDEDHPLDPLSIYGALKVAGEKIVIAYQQVFDLPYTIIRPSALYGPGCVSRRIGQVYIENAFSGSKLRIDGDGTEKLDFTYIEDLVQGVCLVLSNPASRNQIFNMTYGKSRSIQDLAAIMTRHFPAVETEYVERDNLMPVRGTLSVAKATSMLGYQPNYPLEDGMSEYIAWYQKLLGSEEPITSIS